MVARAQFVARAERALLLLASVPQLAAALRLPLLAFGPQPLPIGILRILIDCLSDPFKIPIGFL